MNRIAFVLLSLSLVACFDQRIDVTETVDVMDETDAVDVTADLGSDIAPPTEDVGPAGCGTDCGEHGECTEATQLCVCDQGWTGSACTVCAGGHFGEGCWACVCENGTCDEGLEGTGACACEGTWVGDACSVSLSVPWNDGPYGSEDGATAGDVLFPSTAGDFSLASSWTGDDSFLFLFQYPQSTESVALWEDDPAELFASLPLNTHVVFGSFASDHTFAIQSMETRVQAVLNGMVTQLRDHWSSRVHFVTSKPSDAQGPLSERINASLSFMFGIDRYQRWRSMGWLQESADEASSMKFLGHEARGYNQEHTVRSVDETLGGVALALFEAEDFTAGEPKTQELALPPAEQLLAVDTLGVAVHVSCIDDDEGPGGGCEAEPGVVQLFVCHEESCHEEIARFVTPYARSGSFYLDASPLLPLLDPGGTRLFEVRAEHAVRLSISLIIAHQNLAERPVEAVALWGDAQSVPFDVDYCTAQPTFDAVPATDATRVALVTRITGHGETGTVDQCAALCDHAHHVGVGETIVSESFPTAGTSAACLDPETVTPNQYGDWTRGRAGWCPGSGVQLRVHDVTDALGQGQTLSYSSDREGEPYAAFITNPEGSMPSIRMASWLVSYAPRESSE